MALWSIQSLFWFVVRTFTNWQWPERVDLWKGVFSACANVNIFCACAHCDGVVLMASWLKMVAICIAFCDGGVQMQRQTRPLIMRARADLAILDLVSPAAEALDQHPGATWAKWTSASVTVSWMSNEQFISWTLRGVFEHTSLDTPLRKSTGHNVTMLWLFTSSRRLHPQCARIL